MDSPDPEAGSDLDVRIRRILVALDTSRHSRWALGVAAELAQLLEADLEGLFVEEEAWHRLGTLGSVRVVRSYTGSVGTLESGDLGRELARVAQRLSRQLQETSTRLEVRSRFRVERGRAERVILGAAGEVDLVTVGRTGLSPGRAGRVGRTARALMTDSDTPLLLLHEGARLGRRIVLLYDGSAGAERGLVLAKHLARRRECPLEVAVPQAPGPEAQRLVDRLRERLRGPEGEGAEIHLVARLGASELGRILGVRDDALLVAPRSSPLFSGPELAATLSALRSPLLLL